MKQIFTLLTLAFVLVFSKANSQYVSQGFETSTEVNTLISSCWTFNSVSFTGTPPFTGTGSVISTLGTNASEIITPELVMPASITVSFNYFVAGSNNGNQKVQVLLTDGVTETSLYDEN